MSLTTPQLQHTKLSIHWQIHAVAALQNDRVVGVGNQNAHLGGIFWLLVNTIPGERSWPAIQNPRTRTGHAGVFWFYGVKKEMNVLPRQDFCKPKGFVSHLILIARSQADLIDFHVQWRISRRCCGQHSGWRLGSRVFWRGSCLYNNRKIGPGCFHHTGCRYRCVAALINQRNTQSFSGIRIFSTPPIVKATYRPLPAQR